MHKFLLAAILCCILHSAVAQSSRPTEGAGFYFNSYQRLFSTNADSAMYYLRKLAYDPANERSFQNLLHSVLMQYFNPAMEKRVTNADERKMYETALKNAHYILNESMADTSQRLKYAIYPIYSWVQIQEAGKDVNKMRALAEDLIRTTLAATNDIYENRVGRYALMIWKLVAQQPALKPVADQLLDIVTAKLESYHQAATDPGKLSRAALEQRAWYRYMYAYAAYLRANDALAANDLPVAKKYFQRAFDYSPDLVDRNNKSGYFYDMMTLFSDEKDSFGNDYVDFLLKHHASDKAATLDALKIMALTDPAYKTTFRKFYENNAPQPVAFENYWQNAVSSVAATAPPFTLTLADHSVFNSEVVKQQGKWMLLDYWGTWCTPCRQEHPQLEKFYKDFAKKNADKFTLLTVACADTRERVDAYMSEYKYSFPVVMSDITIEKLFKVNSYPTKLLISPQGKYIVLPFGSDWVAFVKNYTGL